jgi:hypothetical protein
MQFIKQSTSLPIRNVENRFSNKNKIDRKHGKLLPNSIRSIIAGPSNSGKTNIIVSLIENPNGLHFENVYIYSRSLEQEKYKYLRDILTPIKGLGFYTFSSNDEVIDPSNAKPNSIFIFDDVICGEQSNIRNYFSMGRHRGIDCFYLAQTYTRIPKHLIRDNANLIILFKQDLLNLRHVYNDFSVGCDMKFDEFQYLCNKCWSEKYGFLVIDLDSDVNSGRYRKGFDKFVNI